MKIEEFRKIKEELQERKKENNSKISLYDERTRMAKVNQTDNQIGNSLASSMIPYFAIVFALMIMDGNVDISILTNVIPPITIPIIIMGGSLSIGTIVNKLINKKYKTKERFKVFSKSKTQVEKIEEEVYYQIELEKSNNRNKVIDETINNLNDKVSVLSRISHRYDIIDRNALKTEEEATSTLNEISKLLEEKYKELDILITKKVLNDNFWRLRCKGQKGIDMTLVTMGSGVGAMMLTTLPFITSQDLIASYSMIQKNFIMYTSLAVGSLGTSAYWIKRNKDRQKAFDNLNNALGDNALPKKIENTYNEGKEIEVLIESKIREIVIAEVQSIETQRLLEKITSEQTKQNNITNSLGRNSVENIINNLAQTPNGVYHPTIIGLPKEESNISWVQPYLEEDIKTDERIIKKEQGNPKLVKKLTPPKNTDNK